MPQYAVLVTWTEEGIRTVKTAPARAEEFRRSIASAGGKVLALVHTMGVYDAVVIVDLPSDEVANTLLLRLGSDGTVRTTTLKGWSPEEFARLVERV